MPGRLSVPGRIFECMERAPEPELGALAPPLRAADAPPAPAPDRSSITAAQAVELGEALLELTRSAEGGDQLSAGAPWRRRLRAILNGAANFTGRLLTVWGRLELQRPTNWPTGLTYGKLHGVIADGFPVLWVPPADVLDALAQAPDRPARQRVLYERRAILLEHARRFLGEVVSPDLAVDRRVVSEALDCVVDQPSPAQVAALNVAANRAMLEAGAATLGQLARMGRDAAARLTTVGAEHLRISLMLVAIAPALEHFDPTVVDHVHARPNRHVADRVISAVQFTPENALESLLLAVSVLRQAQANREDTTRAVASWGELDSYGQAQLRASSS